MPDTDLGTAEGKIVIDATQAKKGAAQATEAVEKSSKAQEQAAKRLKGQAATAAKAYGVGVAGGLAIAVKAAMDFDQSLANVAAAGGKDAANQMDQVRAKALQLGADTKFSATEAANAMEELIKAGLSVKDVLNGGADAAVNLAAAEGISVPEAAKIAATAMTAFNLKAQQLPGIANKISQAASATKMDVNDFAQAMNQAGAVSKLVGLSFDDMTLAITAMGKAGIVGSDAGTSLKTFLMNLQPQTKKQIELFDKLGITTKGANNQFFDAHGKIKSMTEIAGVLNKALKGMTSAQKQSTLETLFGSDAIRAAAIISDQGSAGMKKLTAEMNNQLSVAEKARVKNNTLAGAVEQLKGSIETAAIQFGTKMIPILKQLSGFIEGVVNAFASLPPGMQQAIIWFGIISTAGLGFGFVAVKIVKTVRDINTVFGITKGFAAFGRGISTATIAARLGAYNIADAFRGMGAKTASGLGTAKTAMGVWAIDAKAKMGQIAKSTASGAKSMAVSFGSMIASGAKAAAQMVKTAAIVVGRWVWMAAQAMARALVMAAAWVIANPWVVIAAAIIALVALIILNWDKIKGVILGALNAIKAFVMLIFNFILGFIKAWFGLLFALFQAQMEAIKIAIETVLNVIKIIWETIWNNIQAVVEFVWNTIKTIIETVINIIKGIIDVVMGVITGDWSRVWNGIKTIVGAVWNGIKSIVTGAINLVKSIVTNTMNGIKNVISTVWNGIINFFGTLGSKILHALGDFGSLLLGIGKALIEGLWKGITGALGWLWDKIKGIASKIGDFFSNILDIGSPSRLFAKFGRWTIEGYVVGLEDTEDQAYNTIKTIAGNIAGDSGFPGSSSAATGGASTTNNYGGASVVVNITAYNPRAESGSDTAARNMRTLADMGAFG